MANPATGPHRPIRPFDFLGSAWRQRTLLSDLVRRDIMGRYRGSAMGLLWSLITPMLMLAIYTFVFSVVFKARWGGTDDSRVFFAINLFAGMIVHGLLAECLNRAPVLVLQNVNYVKRVVFPLELLCWVSLGSALFHALIGLVVLMAFFLLSNGYVPLTAPLVVLVWLPLLLLTLGLSWLLASLGVFLRDISQIMGSVTTILLFLSPVFYPATALPESFRALLYLNPLTFFIEQTRFVMIAGTPPNWWQLAFALGLSLLVAMLGFAWFEKSRRGFADVL
ncbi:ABC transporter permease [Thiocystis violascens]|uniref:Transport permease protein n=1 Tax=Thiocystis violascens (strain ATCC 17096 / DSM 198 / 6111) TaxID=765911 RepID=I3YC78_THIV6|nr:ABC transporter permease [Thiocystis violascens]AFL74596.1 ABC-type polysaccharide/polyol phosphate export systems, permease component [Thiocystis violascens DSM 198]